MDYDKKTLAVGAVVGIVLAAALVAGLQKKNSAGFPCYCKQCEHDLVVAANSGDPVAQQKLSMAIEGGAYQGNVLGMNIGPLAIILGLVILAVIVNLLMSARTQSYLDRTGGQLLDSAVRRR